MEKHLVEKTETPSPDELRRLLRGEVDGERARELYAQLAESEETLDLAEGIWAEESPLIGADSPPLSDRRSERLERRVFGQVHRTHLAEDVAALGTGAFLHVILELLRVALSILRPAKKSSKPTSRRTS